ILSSGADTIKGTPFDSEINQSLRGWRDEQQKSQMPFIIVLRAARGVITHYSVTPAPWKIEMPPLPAELVPPKDLPRTVSQPKTSSVPPLIVSGKKTNVVSAP